MAHQARALFPSVRAAARNHSTHRVARLFISLASQKDRACTKTLIHTRMHSHSSGRRYAYSDQRSLEIHLDASAVRLPIWDSLMPRDDSQIGVTEAMAVSFALASFVKSLLTMWCHSLWITVDGALNGFIKGMECFGREHIAAQFWRVASKCDCVVEISFFVDEQEAC